MKKIRALSSVAKAGQFVLDRISPATRRLLVLAVFWVCFVHLLAIATAGMAIVKGLGPGNWSPQMRAVETPLSRWDSRWFYTIATDGYYSSIPGHESPVRFYPLYPVLMAGSAWSRWRDVVVGGGRV